SLICFRRELLLLKGLIVSCADSLQQFCVAAQISGVRPQTTRNILEIKANISAKETLAAISKSFYVDILRNPISGVGRRSERVAQVFHLQLHRLNQSSAHALRADANILSTASDPSAYCMSSVCHSIVMSGPENKSQGKLDACLRLISW
ncbi:MAG: hypothetical protein WA419_12325, partial [Silvibacterium sp.]